jgi:hypothetical protein
VSALDPALVAILASHFQAGAQGFHGVLFITGTDVPYGPGVKHITVDKSRQADAASWEVEIEWLDDDWYVQLTPGRTVCIYQWYGDLDSIEALWGVVDKVDDSRLPAERVLVVSGRDFMYRLLDPYRFIAIGPQGAEEDGAIRDSTNGVYLGWEVSAIVEDLLDKAGWPADKRLIWPTSYLVDEFVVPPGTPFADALGELRQLVGYDHGCWGESYRFSPPWNVDYDGDGLPVPVVAVTSGVDMTDLRKADDWYDLRTRVRVTGTFTGLKDSWTQTWTMGSIAHPTGVWLDPADPDNVRVLDSGTRKVYTVRRSDRAIIAASGAFAGTFLCGLSGDPADPSVYWLLDAGVGGANNIHKVRKSDNVVLATYHIGAGLWTDLKADASNLWLTNWTDDKLHKFSKTGGDLASYTLSVDGVPQVNPTGLAIDGTDLYVMFNGTVRFLRVASSDPTTILQVISTAGTGINGGEMDSVSHSDLVTCNDSTGTVSQYALKAATENAVSLVVIAGVGEVDPEPTVPTGDLETLYGIRSYDLALGAVTSAAQAAVTALADLARRSHVRTVRDVGMIGNPSIEAGMLVSVVDPVTDTDALGIVDTYRTDMTVSEGGATYVATMAHIPWADVAP